MYKVKVTIANSDKGFNRQLPSGGYVWKNYKFYINTPVDEADFWVVCYQKIPNNQESCRVAPQNTLFITWEPDSVYHFSKGFLNQFAKIVSCQQHLKHHNVVFDQPGLAWHIGMVRKGQSVSYSCDYDSLKSAVPQKEKLLSVISSNKAFTKGHRDRIQFVEKLKSHFGDRMDVFGRGIKDFEDKWDVIAPYKYHICLENCAIPYYWSEKLADSFLGNAFPFYYGCTNVEEYFNKDAYRVIDIHRPNEAIEIIEQAIQGGLADTNAADVEQAKQLVLDKYNFFELVVKHIQQMNPNAPKQVYTIKHDLAFVDVYKFPLYVKRVLNKISSKF